MMDDENTSQDAAQSSASQEHAATPEIAQKPGAAIGLDIGFGDTKAYRGNGKSLTFPSAVAEAPRGSGGRNQVRANFTLTQPNQMRFLVGQPALDHGSVESPSTDSSYFTSDNYRILGLYALDKLAGRQSIELVTGLPVEFHAKLRRRIQSEVSDWKHYGAPIVDVEILPQPVGALFDLSWDFSGNRLDDADQDRVAIVDIGRGTVDCIEVRKGQIHPDKRGGRNEGVTVMHAELYQHLNKAHPDYQLDRTEVPEIMLKGGLYMYGDWIDLQKPIERIKKSFMDRINNLIREVWPEGTARLRRIVFTGGGAAALQPYIEAGGGKTFAAKQAMIPKDPVHANAIGFAKIATMKAKRRG